MEVEKARNATRSRERGRRRELKKGWVGVREEEEDWVR